MTGIKKIFSAVCAVTLGFSCPVYAKAAKPGCEISSWILTEQETGYVISEYNSDKRVPSGALNKLMTALIAAEYIESGEISMETELTASEAAHTATGAVIWLDTGEKITAGELMKALLIGNAGDAAVVFAETIAGGCDEFTCLMNFRAAELGMKNTFFTSPYAIDDDSQYTTAFDTALLTSEIASHEELREIMLTWRDTVRGGKTETVNENTLIRTYEGVNGVKAWHTEQSGYCAAVSAHRSGGKYTAVVLGSEDSEERFDFAKQLLKKGISGYKTIIPGFSSEYMKPLKVKQGTEDSVILNAENLSTLVVPKETEDTLRIVTVSPDYIKAPVRKGQKIGTLAFYLDRTLLYETSLIAADSVPEKTFRKSLRKIIVKMFKE